MEEIYDTFLAERVINCGKQDYGYSLARCTERYLGQTLDKETRNKFVGLKGQPYTVDQITYGANDVVYLLDIREKQLVKIHSLELEQVARLENKVVKVFSEIEYEGLMIDKDKWTAMAEQNVKLAYEQELKLDDMVLEHPLLQHYRVPVQVDMFAPMDEVRKTHIKWSSPMQTLELFRILVPDLEDVNGKKLNKYRYKHKLIDEYIRYKERTKLANAYGTKFFNYVNCDGKVHTNFSHRSLILEEFRPLNQTCSKFRAIIPLETVSLRRARMGFRLFGLFFTGTKCHCLWKSQDPVWLDALEKGLDLHGVCADLVFEDKWRTADADARRSLRTQIKAINFGLAYGMGPFKLADTLQISKAEAEDLIEKYFTEFPNIRDFLTKLGTFGTRNGYITTFAIQTPSLVRHMVPKIWDDRSKLQEFGSVSNVHPRTHLFKGRQLT